MDKPLICNYLSKKDWSSAAIVFAPRQGNKKAVQNAAKKVEKSATVFFLEKFSSTEKSGFFFN